MRRLGVVDDGGQKRSFAMRHIGLIGGFYSEATVRYLRCFDEQMINRFGAGNVMPLTLKQVNGLLLQQAMARKDWTYIESTLTEAARTLVDGGVDAIMLAGSVMHAGVDRAVRKWRVPLLHVADAVALSFAGTVIKHVGLFGPRLPGEEAAWQRRLADHGIVASLLPDEAGRLRVAHIIDEELSRGVVNNESKAELIRYADSFAQLGVNVVILAAPELHLALHQRDCLLSLRDATEYHTAAAVAWATEEIAPRSTMSCEIAS